MAESDTQEIKIQLARIEQILKNMNETGDLKNKALEEKIDVANRRIADLEDTNKWLWRAIAGALIVGVIGLLFAFVK